ncbi:hypothetical protein [Lacimonas salitolerans]|uniref:Sulfotransferase family protein n=1 Tax=Lacimonas salitolerans TaxID=1323750 RepID=A0ABW4EAA0_9RHOB
MARLFLHAGPHKTGTTSFQMALWERRGQQDLAVYVEAASRKNPVNAARFANAFTRPGLMTMPRLKGQVPAPDAPLRAAMRAALAAQAPARGDMVISSEAFSHLRGTREAAALRAALAPFDSVIPILVRRNPADWRAARQDQLRKTGVWETMTALPQGRSSDGPWYYDWQALCDFWAGFGAVRMVDYDAALACDGSVLPALARALDRPGLFDGLEDLWLNRRGEQWARADLAGQIPPRDSAQDTGQNRTQATRPGKGMA